jgi:hypothetical protein
MDIREICGKGMYTTLLSIFRMLITMHQKTQLLENIELTLVPSEASSVKHGIRMIRGTEKYG